MSSLPIPTSRYSHNKVIQLSWTEVENKTLTHRFIDFLNLFDPDTSKWRL